MTGTPRKHLRRPPELPNGCVDGDLAVAGGRISSIITKRTPAGP